MLSLRALVLLLVGTMALVASPAAAVAAGPTRTVRPPKPPQKKVNLPRNLPQRPGKPNPKSP
jgi:P pilus assembly chaperone PapD